LQNWVKVEKTKLVAHKKNVDNIIARAKTAIVSFKAQATKKDQVEVQAFFTTAMARLRAFMASEKLTPAELFKKVAGGVETFDKDKFAAFLVKAPKVESEKEGEDIAEEEFVRAFSTLDEEKSGSVSDETFVASLRKLMKVIKDVALTETLSLTDAKSVRRLEIGEAVEVLQGPAKEGELSRVRAKALKDDLEGWVSVAGTAGTNFLEEGGGVFKVVKETIMTECFEIDGGTKVGSKVKESTRKLKPGELLEVRSWGKKQDGTGLTRMKCKAKADGMIGWVTTLGNTGIKFCELV